MANQEHLEILKQGVGIWNEWRKEHPYIIPNLSEANFSNENLHRSALQNTDLKGAILCGAYLQAANLCGANLFAADLSGSDLKNALLRGAYLRGTKLNGADLINADLNGTCFKGAKLDKCDFSGSIVAFSTFNDVDFQLVKGLDTVQHKGPSSIGIDTLYNSKGNIPEVFLRGCGLSNEFIAYIPSLIGKGIEYYSCFISYSHLDEEFAKRLHNDLQAKGVRCWFAPHDLKIGDKIRPSIDDSIRVHDKLLLILSEHSVQSDWVEHEVEHALSLETERKKTVLFPVRIDEEIMESTTGWAGNVKRQRHIGDFTQWKQHDTYQKAFNRLLRDLKA
ncbi:MAG: toll/interleukin-1 receptor domain-containing protein [Chlorobiaceae bacterium]|nr:toll/interleukin-1 receptor domain-containing protein [Chlorobiaceae bacterium]